MPAADPAASADMRFVDSDKALVQQSEVLWSRLPAWEAQIG